MKTYYCVTSSVDDRGRMTAAVTESMEAEQMPKGCQLKSSKNASTRLWLATSSIPHNSRNARKGVRGGLPTRADDGRQKRPA